MNFGGADFGAANRGTADRGSGGRLPAEERALWRAVELRDPAADGRFFFGVVTTGVYCRPSCPARRARRENVRFFANAAEAERAGLRACRRCRPDVPIEAPLALCRAVLAAAAARPAARWSDRELAAHGFDPVRVRRAFHAQYGRTFHAAWRERRVARARSLVGAGLALSDAGAGAGYESEGGLRSAFRAVLDATPAGAGARRVIHATRIPSPLGTLTAAATDAGVCLLEFDAPARQARADGARTRSRLPSVAARLAGAIVAGANRHLEDLERELAQWFAGERRAFDVPWVLVGTPFEVEVWNRLATIPYGATATYGELARALGRPHAARAVGRANGRNPLAILIPCHRVLGSSGSLTGYAAGLDRKRHLLAHEARQRCPTPVSRFAHLPGALVGRKRGNGA